MTSQQEPLDNCCYLWAGSKYLFFFPMLVVYLASNQEENLEKHVLSDCTRISTSEVSGVAFRKCHPRRDSAVYVVWEFHIKKNMRVLLWMFSHVLKHIHQEHGHFCLSWRKWRSHAIFKTQQLQFLRHHLEHEGWQAKEILGLVIQSFGSTYCWARKFVSFFCEAQTVFTLL